MILVVFIHNYFGNIPPKDTFSYMFQTAFSKGVCYIANPLFFIISGFLFFRKQEALTIKSYKIMMGKKLHTLAIPYLLTSGSIIAIYIIFKIDHYNSVTEILKTWLTDPIPFQLWFLRYLMLLAVISPILYYLIKKTKYIYLIIIFPVWFIFYYKVDWALISLTFFSVGAFISIHGISIPHYNKNGVLLIITAFLWIILSFIACIVYEDNFGVKCIIRNVSILCGLISIWLLYDYCHRFISKLLDSEVLSYSFFIYLFHLPLIIYARKILMRVIPDPYSILSSNVIYILTPIVTIIICIIAGRLLKRFIPPVYNIFTGSR
jgi:surface polysaccharide O-acyltransferase-like enzyme